MTRYAGQILAEGFGLYPRFLLVGKNKALYDVLENNFFFSKKAEFFVL